MNKYLRRGLIYTIIGLLLCGLGYYLMDRGIHAYKWAMIVGVIVFGFGFLTVIYSLIRKIERKSFERYRKNRD